jgi:predicted ABC-type ATPase
LKDKPQILVFAGPNGSGKSTATIGIKIVGLYINTDEIKARSGCSDLESALEAERLREYCLSEKLDFTFETVLSTDRNLDLLRRAKKKGYVIKCIYVLTSDVELNVYRVKIRVFEGGHDVPVDKIRTRYVKSLTNLPELIKICDECTVIDNSLDSPRVIYKKDDKNTVIDESQLWNKRRIIELVEEK